MCVCVCVCVYPCVECHIMMKGVGVKYLRYVI